MFTVARFPSLAECEAAFPLLGSMDYTVLSTHDTEADAVRAQAAACRNEPGACIWIVVRS